MTANRYRPPPEWPPTHRTSEESQRYAGRASAPRHGVAPGADRNSGPQHGTGEWRTIRERSAPRKPAGGRTRRPDASPWHWLLLIPIVVPLVPSLYNRMEPTFLGLPFFYWSQLSFAFLASGVIIVVHRKTKKVTGAGDG